MFKKVSTLFSALMLTSCLQQAGETKDSGDASPRPDADAAMIAQARVEAFGALVDPVAPSIANLEDTLDGETGDQIEAFFDSEEIAQPTADNIENDFPKEYENAIAAILSHPTRVNALTVSYRPDAVRVCAQLAKNNPATCEAIFLRVRVVQTLSAQAKAGDIELRLDDRRVLSLSYRPAHVEIDVRLAELAYLSGEINSKEREITGQPTDFEFMEGAQGHVRAAFDLAAAGAISLALHVLENVRFVAFDPVELDDQVDIRVPAGQNQLVASLSPAQKRASLHLATAGTIQADFQVWDRQDNQHTLQLSLPRVDAELTLDELAKQIRLRSTLAIESVQAQVEGETVLEAMLSPLDILFDASSETPELRVKDEAYLAFGLINRYQLFAEDRPADADAAMEIWVAADTRVQRAGASSHRVISGTWAAFGDGFFVGEAIASSEMCLWDIPSTPDSEFPWDANACN